MKKLETLDRVHTHTHTHTHTSNLNNIKKVAVLAIIYALFNIHFFR